MMAELPTQNPDAPVIAIDGPSGSGKGTICAELARRLGWHLLDSGALYRLTGLAAKNAEIDAENEVNFAKIAELARNLNVRFEVNESLEIDIWLDGEQVNEVIRTETAGNQASKVAAIPAVREALLQRQRDFQQLPGLIADGRDMGTVVFPTAGTKIYLTASAEERAKRRYKQLKQKGINVNLAALSREIEERDERDASRPVAPLKPAADAKILDTTGLSIEQVVDAVLAHIGHKA